MCEQLCVFKNVCLHSEIRQVPGQLANAPPLTFIYSLLCHRVDKYYNKELYLDRLEWW